MSSDRSRRKRRCLNPKGLADYYPRSLDVAFDEVFVVLLTGSMTFYLDGSFVRNIFFRNPYASPARPRRSELRDAGSGTEVDDTEDLTQGGATALWFTVA